MDVSEPLNALPEMSNAAGALWQEHFRTPLPQQTSPGADRSDPGVTKFRRTPLAASIPRFGADGYQHRPRPNDVAQHGRSLMDAPESLPNWKTVPRKLQAYEALYWFNRSIEATLESLDGLKRLGLLRDDDLNEHKIRIEHARAQANEDLTDRLQDYETEESVRFDRMESELEKRRQDPNDVFFAANDRKREIRQQITELQQALERQSPRLKRQKKK